MIHQQTSNGNRLHSVRLSLMCEDTVQRGECPQGRMPDSRLIPKADLFKTQQGLLCLTKKSTILG